MIQILLAALVAMIALGDASPSPSASPVPSPIPTTSPTPAATAAPILGGITLGEDAKGVLRRFNLRTMGTPSLGGPAIVEGMLGQVRFFPANYGDVVMFIVFTDKVKLVMALGTSDPKAHCADPFGVRLGDAPERLIQLRGNPDGYGEDGVVRYGPANGIHWIFSVRNDRISSIGVADGA